MAVAKSGKNGSRYKITIIKDRCKGCELCVTYCPTETLNMSKDINEKGYFIPKVKDISRCKGCDQCSKFCPDFAIFCTDTKKKKNND